MTNEKRVPELRFPEFSGEWEKNVLIKMSNKISDGLHATPKYDENGEYSFINGNNLINGKVDVKNSKKITASEFARYKNDLIPFHTLLLSINGTIGNLALYSNELLLLGKSAAYINFKSEILNRKFLFYGLQTGRIKKFFNSELTGTTIKNLSLKSIGKSVVNYPTLEEQQKIGEFFSKLDRQIELEEKKLALLEEQKKGYMQKIFSQELRFKDENGEDYPEWEQKQLNEIVIYENGLAHENYVVEEGKYILVNSKFISTNGEVKKTVSHGESLAMKGDTLLVLSDLPNGKALAKGYFVNESNKYAVNQRIAKMRPIETHPYFLFLILNRNKHLLKFDNGVSQTNLRKNDILHIKEFIPVLNEQKKISSLMGNMDSCIIKLSQKISLLKIKKQELLNNMLV